MAEMKVFDKTEGVGGGAEGSGSVCGAPFPPPSTVHSSKCLHGEDPTLEVSHHELHMVENTKDSTYEQILEQMS